MSRFTAMEAAFNARDLGAWSATSDGLAEEAGQELAVFSGVFFTLMGNGFGQFAVDYGAVSDQISDVKDDGTRITMAGVLKVIQNGITSFPEKVARCMEKRSGESIHTASG